MAPQREEARNLQLLSHHDLDGYGNGGEGIALQVTKSGRRILYIAHESAPKDFTGIDVTDPKDPRLVVQTELHRGGIRSNSLALVDDLLLVAYQSSALGTPSVGVGIYDVGDPANPKQVSFFDTSGPHSRGAHCLWFVDGKYAHVSTGSRRRQARVSRRGWSLVAPWHQGGGQRACAPAPRRFRCGLQAPQRQRIPAASRPCLPRIPGRGSNRAGHL